VAVSPGPAYDVPGSAASLKVSLVPEYRQTISASQCAARGGTPSTHGTPLSLPSCNPPQPTQAPSARVGGGGSGNAIITVGSSDVGLTVLDFDIRDASGFADYTASLKAIFRVRFSDSSNCAPTPCGSVRSQAGTGTDVTIGPMTIPCVPTGIPSAPPGSFCSASTSANALLPGSVVSGKRTVWQAFRVRVLDSGNRLFQQQGIYVP
jgi:hypothetical protein